MGETHFFDSDVATKYGVNAAILFQNFYFWIRHNEANKTNYYEGTYWTYNSISAFKDYFPYMGQRAIRNAINVLIENGLLKTGNFNKSSYDRTLWYAITDSGFSLVRESKMDLSKKPNGGLQKVEPIPDIKTDSKSSNIEQLSSDDIKRIIEAWNSLGLAKIIKIPKNTERYKSLSARVSEYSVEEVLQAIARIRKSRFLRGSNDKHWKISFDWLVKPNRFPRVLEGNYDDEEEDLF